MWCLLALSTAHRISSPLIIFSGIHARLGAVKAAVCPLMLISRLPGAFSPQQQSKMSDIQSSAQIRRITREHAACLNCGLPELTCLCGQVKPIKTRSRFVLLTSPKEFTRPSNTGRLLKLINPEQTEILAWERKPEPGSRLCELAQTPGVCLVYPAPLAHPRRIERPVHPESVLILLDGTWQEALKMYRKSQYLSQLFLLSLPETVQSTYRLRENQLPSALCTIEAAAICLDLNAETDSAQALQQIFEQFQCHYLAGLAGHSVKHKAT